MGMMPILLPNDRLEDGPKVTRMTVITVPKNRAVTTSMMRTVRMGRFFSAISFSLIRSFSAETPEKMMVRPVESLEGVRRSRLSTWSTLPRWFRERPRTLKYL